MKDYMKQVATHATGIILAALAAAAITFFQSLAAATGTCEPAPVKVEDASLVGGFLKAAHSVFIYKRSTFLS